LEQTRDHVLRHGESFGCELLNSIVRPRIGEAMNVLFVCTQNRLRSPTAEQVFAEWPGIQTQSAGLASDAANRVSPENLAWADLIFVMEKAHRNKLSKKFRAHLGGKRVVCLGIPDEYEFMDPVLVALLRRAVSPFLPRSIVLRQDPS
jgi:predicted protein tyrosine phosphatase